MNRELTVGHVFKEKRRGYKKTLRVRLEGDWLKEAGLDYGDKINVTVFQNQIIINK